MKQVNNSRFLRYEEPELKDGVDYYVLIMSEWNKKVGVHGQKNLLR